MQGQSGYRPEQFTGGAAQNPTYIGFVQTIRAWAKDGIKGERPLLCMPPRASGRRIPVPKCECSPFFSLCAVLIVSTVILMIAGITKLTSGNN